jgi:hypothetical protein
MATATAWLMDFGKGRVGAVGERELLHIVYQPRLHRLPQANPHCDRVLAWESGFVPVWDFAAWFQSKQTETRAGLIALVGYTTRDTGQMRRGALGIVVPPKRISVRDEDACSLPDDRWQSVATSCFLYEKSRIPTLDLIAMFDGPTTAPENQGRSVRADRRDA